MHELWNETVRCRRYPRFDVYLPLSCRRPTLQGSVEIPGKAKDLGREGLQVLLPEPLPTDSPVHLCLGTGGGALEMSGRIVWIGHPRATLLGGSLVPHGVVLMRPLDRGVVETIVLERISERAVDVAPRVESKFRVDCFGPEFSTGAFCLNISRAGLCLSPAKPALPGEEILLHFRLPGTWREITVRGRVVWRNPYSDQNAFPPGMGIRFLDLSPSDADLITEFVARGRRRQERIPSVL
ncbi:MAG: PilZ domain-containing protein [Candidatus Methylomirabilales bacterium]